MPLRLLLCRRSPVDVAIIPAGSSNQLLASRLSKQDLAMPLLDHFHPPVSERRSWEGFHGLWAAALVEKLNRDILADEYFADMQVHIGSQVEVDIAILAGSRGAQERSSGAA